MREPKFRGFSLETKQWYYGHGWFEIDYTDEYLKEKGIEPQAILYTDYERVQCELKSMGEYTGLKDKNFREIYEGDIISIPRWRNSKYQVVFESGMYRAKNLDEESKVSLATFKGEVSCEVIGNIYEHPHLLEGDSK